MVKPERRTKADLLAAAAIVTVVAAAAALIWWTSDARATISRPATVPAPNPTPAHAVPTSLRELWRADSPATAEPVAVGGSVVTGNDRVVEGHDPITGAVRWSYSRDSDLCGVSWVYRLAVAVYRDDRGCGQVSTLDGVDRPAGARPQQLQRPTGGAVVRRHDGDVRRRYPAGGVALGHGPDVVLRRDRRPGQAVVEGAAHRLPTDLGCGQLISGIGVRGMRPAGRPTA